MRAICRGMHRDMLSGPFTAGTKLTMRAFYRGVRRTWFWGMCTAGVGASMRAFCRGMCKTRLRGIWSGGKSLRWERSAGACAGHGPPPWAGPATRPVSRRKSALRASPASPPRGTRPPMTATWSGTITASLHSQHTPSAYTSKFSCGIQG